MKEPQVLHGTWTELAKLAPELGDRQVTLVITGDDEGSNEHYTGPPEVVETQERLEELLLEGLASPSIEMTDDVWDRLITRFERKAENR